MLDFQTKIPFIKIAKKFFSYECMKLLLHNLQNLI